MTRDFLEKMFREGRLSFRGVINHSNGAGYIRFYKCRFHSSDSTVSDEGYFCLTPGSFFGVHWHHFDSEEYTVLHGVIECNGQLYHEGDSVLCPRGSKHNCRNVTPNGGEAIVHFIKRE